MLSNAVELWQVAGKSADMREGGGNILDLDRVLLDVEIIKVFTRKGLNKAHFFLHTLRLHSAVIWV